MKTVEKRKTDAKLRKAEAEESLFDGQKASDYYEALLAALENPEFIHTRSMGRGGLLRIEDQKGRSLIIKLWSNGGFKSGLKSALRRGSGYTEWRIQKHLSENGCDVPAPLHFSGCVKTSNGRYEAIVMEDLGKTESGVDYIKNLLKNGKEEKLNAFENGIIISSRKMLELNVIDIDNQIDNYLADANGRPWRIDFECARISGNIPTREFAVMLERLYRSHLHAVYPEIERTPAFISRAAAELGASDEARRMMTEISAVEIERERRSTGIDYSVDLGWR